MSTPHLSSAFGMLQPTVTKEGQAILREQLQSAQQQPNGEFYFVKNFFKYDGAVKFLNALSNTDADLFAKTLALRGMVRETMQALGESVYVSNSCEVSLAWFKNKIDRLGNEQIALIFSGGDAINECASRTNDQTSLGAWVKEKLDPLSKKEIVQVLTSAGAINALRSTVGSKWVTNKLDTFTKPELAKALSQWQAISSLPADWAREKLDTLSPKQGLKALCAHGSAAHFFQGTEKDNWIIKKIDSFSNAEAAEILSTSSASGLPVIGSVLDHGHGEWFTKKVDAFPIALISEFLFYGNGATRNGFDQDYKQNGFGEWLAQKREQVQQFRAAHKQPSEVKEDFTPA